MDRRYSCALFVVVLVGCVSILGCHGSGTAPLSITTTSLPSGTVNTPYSTIIEGAGGTLPYTWSQVSGGNMPPGITFSAAGVLGGTPTKAGTFGPYVFKVVDANSDVAQSVGLTVKIAASSLSVTTTSLPNGVVGIGYSTKLAATGGAPPYSWTVTSGTLPPGLSLGSDGTISGTPTTAGSYGPYVFTVTDSNITTALSGQLSITVTGTTVAVCTALGNEAALTPGTPYGFLLKGTDGSGNPIYIAGSFTPNGAGGINAAEADYNGFSDGPQQLQVNLDNSSYSFGSSAQGCLYLAFSGLASTTASEKQPPSESRITPSLATITRIIKKPQTVAVPVASVQFSFYLTGFDATTSTYNTGRIIESDNTNGKGTNASGFIHAQTTGDFALTALQANYAFGVDGWTSTASGVLRTAMAGTFTNAAGTLSTGFADVDAGGTVSGEQTGGYGTLMNTTIDTNGRGTGSFFTNSAAGKLTFDFVFYILNGSDLILLSTDLASSSSTTPLLAGRALVSSASYTATPLNGYYLLASQGLQSVGASIGNIAEIGTLNAINTGAIPTATIYSNYAGTYATNEYPASSYTVEAASGRTSVTGITSSPPIVYLTASTADDGIAGFLVGTDAQSSSGVLVLQTAATPSFSTASVTGYYAASTGEDVDGSNGAFLGGFNFDGTGAYTLLSSLVTGTLTNVPAASSILINTDGSGNLQGGKFPFVTNGTVLFAIPNSGDPLLYVFTEGTIAP